MFGPLTLTRHRSWSATTPPGHHEVDTDRSRVDVAAGIGLAAHCTAGYIDPGWSGDITLELSNVGPYPLTLGAGMLIGQLVFEAMSSPVERPYGSRGLGSKYQGQRGPTPARTFEEAA